MTGTVSTPADLKAAGLALWESVLQGGDETGDDDKDAPGGLTLRPDELAVLESACRTADLIADLQATIDASESMVTGSRGQSVLHPAIPEIRQQRQLLASLLAKLDIPEGDGLGAEGSEWEGLSNSQRARKAAGIRHRGRS